VFNRKHWWILALLLIGLTAVSGSAFACMNMGFEDGVYRGMFSDRGEIQVNVEFTLEDNVVTAIRYRHLAHQGVDYLQSEDEDVQMLAGQYKQLIDYLVGKDIRDHVNDLHNPGEIIEDESAEDELPWWELERYAIDAFTGATTRGSKVVSALRDGLSRGVYNY